MALSLKNCLIMQYITWLSHDTTAHSHVTKQLLVLLVSTTFEQKVINLVKHFCFYTLEVTTGGLLTPGSHCHGYGSGSYGNNGGLTSWCHVLQVTLLDVAQVVWLMSSQGAGQSNLGWIGPSVHWVCATWLSHDARQRDACHQTCMIGFTLVYIYWYGKQFDISWDGCF